MSRSREKIATKFRGFIVKGYHRTTHKLTKLSPPFHSKDAAETTLNLLKNDPAMVRDYEQIYLTEE